MLPVDPDLVRLMHEERLREAAERHKIAMARTWEAAPPRWVLRFLPRRGARRSPRPDVRVA